MNDEPEVTVVITYELPPVRDGRRLPAPKLSERWRKRTEDDAKEE